MPARKGNKTMKNKGGRFFSLRRRWARRGGAGAAEHGVNVFGGIGEQGPVSANDNTIAMKNISGGSRKGGSMLVDVGTPLVLTGLNQYMKRRSAKKGGKKVGGKCSLKGGKKVKLGGKPKSRKMMKKKMGGKRRSMKKKGRKMRGGELKCADGSTPVEKNDNEIEDNDNDKDGDHDGDNDGEGTTGEDKKLVGDEFTRGGDEKLNVTLASGAVTGGGDEKLNVTLAPGAVTGGGDEYPHLTLPPGTN